MSIVRPPLAYEELRDIIDLTLWAGQIMLQHGAESARVEETAHRLGTALGCDWLDILVSPNIIAITATSGNDFRTKLRRVVRLNVDFTRVSAINRLARRVEAGELDRPTVRSELERISTMPGHYPPWLVVLVVGLACAAFSRLFGGDWPVFFITWGAASVAMAVRLYLTYQNYNPILVTGITAFVGGLLASSASWLNLSPHPQIALTATVLLLVPGVPLVTGLEDLLEGYYIVGLSRALHGTLILLALALGLLLAMRLVGISGL